MKRPFPFRIYKYVVLLVLISQAAGIYSQNMAPFSVAAGISPNTMGTIGETVQLSFRPLSFLTLGIDASHNKIYQHDLEFDRYGGPLFGDVTKDILNGTLKAGGNFSLSVLEIDPFVSFNIKQTETDSLARIITEVDPGQDPYPQDTEAFVDIDEMEVLAVPGIGTDIGIRFGTFSLGINGSYSPSVSSKLEGGFLQNFGDWPSSAGDYPSAAEYWWRVNSYDFEGSGTQYLLGADFDFRLPLFPMRVRGFGNMRLFTYDGTTRVDNSYYYPYRFDVTDDTEIIETSQTALAQVDVADTELEAGLSFTLLFFKEYFNVPGTPKFDIAYVHVMRDIEFHYYDPTESREKWIEEYGYTKFTISWGL